MVQTHGNVIWLSFFHHWLLAQRNLNFYIRQVCNLLLDMIRNNRYDYKDTCKRLV